MKDKRHAFENDAIRVTWSRTRCIHAAECVKRLGAVFRPGEKPWIQLEHGSPDAVADVVAQCPTGALQFERRDGGAAEAPAEHNTVLVGRDGPTLLRGDLHVCDAAGQVIARETRLALCRCGQSKNKPFCDNSHRDAGFRDAGELHDLDAVMDPGAPGSALRVIPGTDGPVQLEGPFVIGSADGQVVLQGSSTWLCRCGQSKNKPFCDGTHGAVGFRAE